MFNAGIDRDATHGTARDRETGKIAKSPVDRFDPSDVPEGELRDAARVPEDPDEVRVGNNLPPCLASAKVALLR